MTREEKINLALQLNQEVASLLKKPLIKVNVNPEWRAKRINGQWSYVSNTLSISKYLVKDSDIKGVILHELCHAYAPLGAHHGPEWKAIAAIVGRHYGETIQRCNNREKTAEAVIKRTLVATATCPCCGATWKYYRRSKIYQRNGEGWYCTKCGPVDGKLLFKKLK